MYINDLCKVIVKPIMPRVYKKKLGVEGKRNYRIEYLHNTIREVRAGRLSIRKASENYGVPYTTLNENVKGKYSKKFGGQPVISDAEEAMFVESIVKCAEWGFSLRRVDIQKLIQGYLNRLGRRKRRFKNNFPGTDGFYYL